MMVKRTVAINMHYFNGFNEGASRVDGNNRRILNRRSVDGKRQIVRTLHGHEVVCLTEEEDGYTLLLDNCGYTTRTTTKAMQEFIVSSDCRWFYVSATSIVLRKGEALSYSRSVEIPLDHAGIPMQHYSDFEIKGTAVHYKVWHQLPAARELIGDYALQSDVPDGIKALTKGWVDVNDHNNLKRILRCKKPESRMTRLTALLLTGEATIHRW